MCYMVDDNYKRGGGGGIQQQHKIIANGCIIRWHWWDIKKSNEVVRGGRDA